MGDTRTTNRKTNEYSRTPSHSVLSDFEPCCCAAALAMTLGYAGVAGCAQTALSIVMPGDPADNGTGQNARNTLAIAGKLMMHAHNPEALIRYYQRFIRPTVLERYGTMCKFTPTCSDYGLEAVREHGAVRGSMMSISRILRCNPYAHGGYDPVR